MLKNFTAAVPRAFALAALLLGASAGWASALEPVTLPEPPPSPAFTIIDGARKTPIDLAELEQLGVYRMVTTSPWEKGTFVYEGVLLRDVLKSAGLDREKAVRIRAADHYTQVIPREDWTEVAALLATRENGKILTRREKGPTRLVYPIAEHPELDTENYKRRWVWLIETIETVD